MRASNIKPLSIPERQVAIEKTKALALAIKLAMWGWGTDMDYKSASTPNDPWDEIEAAAVASLYKHADSFGTP